MWASQGWRRCSKRSGSSSTNKKNGKRVAVVGGGMDDRCVQSDVARQRESEWIWG